MLRIGLRCWLWFRISIAINRIYSIVVIYLQLFNVIYTNSSLLLLLWSSHFIVKCTATWDTSSVRTWIFFSMGRLNPSCHPGDTAQESWPYYHRAIMESGTGSFWSYITLDAAKGNWQQVLNATKCSSEAENRRLSQIPRDPTPTAHHSSQRWKSLENPQEPLTIYHHLSILISDGNFQHLFDDNVT